MITPLKHEENESLCRRWCVEDCFTARHYNPQDVPAIAGRCPKDCMGCLYTERHKRDDASWIPQPMDKQYYHWGNR